MKLLVLYVKPQHKQQRRTGQKTDVTVLFTAFHILVRCIKDTDLLKDAPN